MQLTADHRLRLSASDLVAFLECDHLSALDLRVARGLEVIEAKRTDSAELVARKGDEHEQAFLGSLIEQRLDVVVVPSVFDSTTTLEEAVEATNAAMRDGAEVIYQGALADGDWRGFADFLGRVSLPSPAFGDYSYEVVDTKLAKRSKPSYVVQLCLYSDLLARVQGRLPERMHVELGSGARDTFRLDEFSAFYRRLRSRYGSRLAEGFDDTYPEPVAHCGLCRWSEHCVARWEADDHLSLVAGLGRAQAVRLGEVGITTCAQLAVAGVVDRPHGSAARHSIGCVTRRNCSHMSAPPGSSAMSCSIPRTGVGLRDCPNRSPVTCTSTWRATRSTRGRGSNICSASPALRTANRCSDRSGRVTAMRRRWRSSSSSTS
jgi:uncharacterized protein